MVFTLIEYIYILDMPILVLDLKEALRYSELMQKCIYVSCCKIGTNCYKNCTFQTNDLRIVHRGIKFSCRFTVSELQSRWYALLYNAEISRVAIAAMRNLHPDLIAAVQQQALYSTAEEELLGTLASVSHKSIHFLVKGITIALTRMKTKIMNPDYFVSKFLFTVIIQCTMDIS